MYELYLRFGLSLSHDRHSRHGAFLREYLFISIDKNSSCTMMMEHQFGFCGVELLEQGQRRDQLPTPTISCFNFLKVEYCVLPVYISLAIIPQTFSIELRSGDKTGHFITNKNRLLRHKRVVFIKWQLSLIERSNFSFLL